MKNVHIWCQTRLFISVHPVSAAIGWELNEHRRASFWELLWFKIFWLAWSYLLLFIFDRKSLLGWKIYKPMSQLMSMHQYKSNVKKHLDFPMLNNVWSRFAIWYKCKYKFPFKHENLHKNKQTNLIKYSWCKQLMQNRIYHWHTQAHVYMMELSVTYLLFFNQQKTPVSSTQTFHWAVIDLYSHSLPSNPIVTWKPAVTQSCMSA